MNFSGHYGSDIAQEGVKPKRALPADINRIFPAMGIDSPPKFASTSEFDGLGLVFDLHPFVPPIWVKDEIIRHYESPANAAHQRRPHSSPGHF